MPDFGPKREGTPFRAGSGTGVAVLRAAVGRSFGLTGLKPLRTALVRRQRPHLSARGLAWPCRQGGGSAGCQPPPAGSPPGKQAPRCLLAAPGTARPLLPSIGCRGRETRIGSACPAGRGGGRRTRLHLPACTAPRRLASCERLD